MMLRFASVADTDSIKTLASLAEAIWHEYWPAIIGMEQTDYMIERFQSFSALERDIRSNGYRYYLTYDESNILVGYTGAVSEDFSADPLGTAACAHGAEIAKRFSRRLFISKIYLKKEERGKHYASRIIEFWETKARAEGLECLYLTVNKHNDLGVRAYLGRGFETIESLAADIGNGFVMDDYIMTKKL